jgi:hypothetical protein
MAKDMATGVLVTPEAVAWATLRHAKEGPECAAEGRYERLVEEESGVEEESSVAPQPLAEIKSSVVLALPPTQLLMRVLEFPAVGDDELADMVELQVDKFYPFPIDQMVVAHEVLSRDEQNCAVLVAAAKETAIDEAADVLKAQGLRIRRVDVALMGRWKTIGDAGQLAKAGRETLVIVSEGTVEVLTHESGTPIALSCLGRTPDLTDAGMADDIAQEVAHLLMGLEVERGRHADGSAITLWSEEPLAVFGAALQQACDVAVGERSLGMLPPVAHGVALREMTGDALLDLTPSLWRQTETSKRTRRQMLVAGLSVLGAWGLFVGGGLGWLAFEKGRLAQLEEDEVRWLEPANEVRRLRLQVNMIERYMDHTYSALECLREISAIQPQGVDLTSFTYRKGEGMDIDGEADSGPLVNQFNEALNQSELFNDVKPGTRTMTRKGRHRFSFDITFPEVTL